MGNIPETFPLNHFFIALQLQLLNQTHMKTAFLHFTLLVCSMFLCLSCSDEEVSSPIGYNLPQRFRINVPDDTAIIAKSQADFDRLFQESAGELAEVDFDRYDLVYIQGASSSGIEDLQAQWNLESIPYELSVRITYNLTAEYCVWSLAYLIAKSESNQVTASVVYTNH